jgi:hypothetical protein
LLAVLSGQLLLGTLIVIPMVFFHVSALMGLAGFIDRIRHSPMFLSRRLGNSYLMRISVLVIGNRRKILMQLLTILQGLANQNEVS